MLATFNISQQLVGLESSVYRKQSNQAARVGTESFIPLWDVKVSGKFRAYSTAREACWVISEGS